MPPGGMNPIFAVASNEPAGDVIADRGLRKISVLKTGRLSFWENRNVRKTT